MSSVRTAGFCNDRPQSGLQEFSDILAAKSLGHWEIDREEGAAWLGLARRVLGSEAP